MDQFTNGSGAAATFARYVDPAVEEMRSRIAFALSCLDTADMVGDSLSGSSPAFLRCRMRIAEAVTRMEASGVSLRATEARLAFEGARLKRSIRELRKVQEDLNLTRADLARRAEKARGVAEVAARSAALIEEIQTALARGEPVEHLLEAGEKLVAEQVARRRAE